MLMYDVILKKRNGQELSSEEIDFFINGYTSGVIPDYQASALLMAIYFSGLNRRETADLTMAMCNSGQRIDLSEIPGKKVDKHSTGGVGDKTTLVLVPMVAAAGVPVAKMSGRGLGHTGGTIDKLESITGFNAFLSPEEFIGQVRRIGAAVAAQTGDLAPADKKLYALRDVTATVDSIPLIASSVMSKKIASGADVILLDVKVGAGAFMKKVEPAYELARVMVEIGTEVGRDTAAVITNMDQPLGYAVGNALEVKEAVRTLHGEGPQDLAEVCLVLGSLMLYMAKKAENKEQARQILVEILNSGRALRKLGDIIAAQGGDVRVLEDPGLLPFASIERNVKSASKGFIQSINAEKIGRAAMILGAGRVSKDAGIDHAAGIVLNKKVGDPVLEGDTLAFIHCSSQGAYKNAEMMVYSAYTISDVRPEQKPHILGTVPGAL